MQRSLTQQRCGAGRGERPVRLAGRRARAAHAPAHRDTQRQRSRDSARPAPGRDDRWARARAHDSPPALEIHHVPQGSTSRPVVEPRPFCVVSNRPSHRSPFGNGSENRPESARIEEHAARVTSRRKAAACRRKAVYNAASGSSCHAEGRGFESHQPLSGGTWVEPVFGSCSTAEAERCGALFRGPGDDLGTKPPGRKAVSWPRRA
jgi:hypothetical protein